MTVLHGDCRDMLQTLPDNSIDSIVTDPPYEIGFMGKGWDGSGVANDPKLWAECFRVLKPGGHVLAFGAARTYHRMACAIEDAGFEIRDSIHWVYGSGFPKSHNVSKGIDRRGGSIVPFAEFRDALANAIKRNNIDKKALTAALGNFMLSHYLTEKTQPALPNLRDYLIIRDFVDLGNQFDSRFIPEADREVIGKSLHKSGIANGTQGHRTVGGTIAEHVDITAPATDDARLWEGWGTALKPAHEPIVMARKPFAGTVAQNVLEHGTGAINIDGARIGETVETWPSSRSFASGISAGFTDGLTKGPTQPTGNAPSGRWPANVLLTHNTECGPECMPDCPAREIERQAETASRYYAQPEWAPGDYLASVYTPKAGKKERNAGLDGMPERLGGSLEGGNDKRKGNKPQLSARANHHPTVKPVALMRYLIRLVTPPGGLVLDPFLGSGTTAVAAILEGYDWIGCEITADYLPIITARTANAANDYPANNTIQNPDNTTQTQMGLFDRHDQ